MTRARVLAGVVGLLTVACQPMNQEKYLEERALRRWSVRSAEGAALASSCTVWKSEFPSPAVAFDAYPAAKLGISAGKAITYEDNLGSHIVMKSRVGEPLPTTDEFWCADFEKHIDAAFGLAGLGCITVLDDPPAAKLDSVELIEPSSPSPVIAEGFRAALTVLGPGPVTLGVPSSCQEGFPFSFTAMVIEP